MTRLLFKQSGALLIASLLLAMLMSSVLPAGQASAHTNPNLKLNNPNRTKPSVQDPPIFWFEACQIGLKVQLTLPSNNPVDVTVVGSADNLLGNKGMLWIEPYYIDGPYANLGTGAKMIGPGQTVTQSYHLEVAHLPAGTSHPVITACINGGARLSTATVTLQNLTGTSTNYWLFTPEVTPFTPPPSAIKAVNQIIGGTDPSTVPL